MFVSLVVIRLEIIEKYPFLKHIIYPEDPLEKSSRVYNTNEISPADWPPLASDRLFAIHRGLRKPNEITVITLTSEFIQEEMAALKKDLSVELEDDLKSEKKSGSTDKSFYSGTGSIPRLSSKESTPGPSSSKEGTPGVGEEGASRRVNWQYKDRLHFISGNPMVDVTKGILHLFKENHKTSLDEGHKRSEMLCMLAVPTSTTIHDLLQFTAPCYPTIQNLKIIKDSNPNQYMVLIKFRSQADADLFYNSFNGQPFNSIEPDICRLIYVAKVETTHELEEGGLPIPGHSELPTCPVCLERMDESVEGILTILCNHSFHGECLAKWGDTSCPICRYCQTPEEVPDQRCLSCSSTESLWICLICGHVGCGRYAGGHAHMHFMETNHLFSLQVGNNRVWDYVHDNYVHRLLQSEGDGKVVSYERGPTSEADTKTELLSAGEEKLTALQLEYTHLLSSQLESQRDYFETKIAESQSEAYREADDFKALAQKKAEEVSRVKEDLTVVNKDKQAVDKKLMQSTTKLNKVIKDFETEQELNNSLREGRKEWTHRVEILEQALLEKDKKITDLESQVSDIMTHLEAMSTINGNPELQGGSVLVGENKAKKPTRRRSKQ